MLNNNKIDLAMAKYPKAKRIAVENFTSFGQGTWDTAAQFNLYQDAHDYKWNFHTIQAIKMVMQSNVGLA